MADTYEEIMSAALSLPPGSRAMLAEQLLGSLDAANQKHIDSVWADEVERRIRQIDTGQAEPLSGDQVLAGLRSRST
jgi:putative addiction module component (TIGR02574 family)